MAVCAAQTVPVCAQMSKSKSVKGIDGAFQTVGASVQTVVVGGQADVKAAVLDFLCKLQKLFIRIIFNILRRFYVIQIINFAHFITSLPKNIN